MALCLVPLMVWVESSISVGKGTSYTLMSYGIENLSYGIEIMKVLKYKGSLSIKLVIPTGASRKS